MDYKLLPTQAMITEDWVKAINIDPFEYAKKMMVLGKQLWKKASGEYESHSLRKPFRIISLLLDKIFGRGDGTIYKLNWVPLIYNIAFESTVFNWAFIISDSLSSCSGAT